MLRRNVPMTVFLFLIMTLHTATLGCFQWPHSYISRQFESGTVPYKFVFYAVAIAISLLHQPISKRIGLKLELAGGVLSSAAGMLLFITRVHFFPGNDWILMLCMILMGVSMLSVINCLVTYVVLVFTNKTLLGIIGLFAFANIGMMAAPQILRLGGLLHLTTEIIFFIVTLLLMYGAGILILFDEPASAEDSETQSGGYLRKAMPLRLSLYVLAIIAYGLTEGIFSLWGEGLISHTMTVAASRVSASSFWLSMVVGEILLLFLFQYFDPRKIYFLMAFNIVIALIWLASVSSFPLFVLGMILGGLGCSAMFPTTLAFLEREIQFLSHGNKDRYLSLIERGISCLTSSYMFGVGVTDLITDWLDTYFKGIFLVGLIYAFAYIALIAYLNLTRRKESL